VKKFIAMLLIAGVVITTTVGCGTPSSAPKKADTPAPTDKKDKDK
jgi:hypothetical protein